MNNDKIDFVITWVDGGDKNWLKEKNKYLSNDINIDALVQRYRDWDILRYWFRSVEKNAPWVNKIHFVTCGQIPEWLNIENPKLNIVNHKDFMPKDDLPTFNSCAIEVNFNKISGLSEKFVYFNDDMFLNNKVEKGDFFKNDKPMDSFIFTPINASNDVSACIHYNCMKVINSHFDFKKHFKINRNKIINLKYGKYLYKNLTLSVYPFYVGIRFHHLPTSFLKSTFDEVWASEEDYLKKVSKNKFRTNNDVSQWLFQFWQLAKGDFEVRKGNFGKYYDLSNDFENALKELSDKKHCMLCLNDTSDIIDFEDKKERMQQVFEELYPSKSSFEK